MHKRYFVILAVIALSLLARVEASGCSCIQQRTTILAVGSSTVYPFSTYVSEVLGSSTKYAIPMVVGMDSGKGIKLFNENSNVDIANSSRRMTRGEYKVGQSNGVGPIIEFGFGYDGIILAHHKEQEELAFTTEEIFLAIAKEVPLNGRLVSNPYRKWSDINPKFPDWNIKIFGPDLESGTFAALQSLVLHKVSSQIPEYAGRQPEVRSDGVYNYQGENEGKIIHEVMNNRKVIGILGYSYLKNGGEYIYGVSIDGVKPSKESIIGGQYPLTRKLYMYLKENHLGMIGGLKEFFDLLMSNKMSAPDGALERLGLITHSFSELEVLRQAWGNKAVLHSSEL